MIIYLIRDAEEEWYGKGSDMRTGDLKGIYDSRIIPCVYERDLYRKLVEHLITNGKNKDNLIIYAIDTDKLRSEFDINSANHPKIYGTVNHEAIIDKYDFNFVQGMYPQIIDEYHQGTRPMTHNTAVDKMLKDIEKKGKIEILLASDIGENGTGYPSVNSKEYVLFVYKHPMSWYLRVDDTPKVIDVEKNGVKLTGYDLNFALRLLHDEKIEIIKLLTSPVIYKSTDTILIEGMSALESHLNMQKVINYYLKIATNAYQLYEKQEDISYIHYLKAIRPVLAMMWVANYKKIPALDLDQLLSMKELPDDFTTEMRILLNKKTKTREQDFVKRDKVIDNFICEKIEEYKEIAKTAPTSEPLSYDWANKLFAEWIQ
jgi:predicted nucleotidyltransferase